MVIILAACLFILSSIIHITWWRIRMPIRTSSALLSIYFGSLVITIFFYSLLWATKQINIHPAPLISFIILYSSSSLVYIILYSAIEQESPTLAIVNFINQTGNSSHDIQSLNTHFNASNEIKNRLTIMEQTGWLTLNGSSWSLTEKGRNIATIFEYAARIFGLNKGG